MILIILSNYRYLLRMVIKLFFSLSLPNQYLSQDFQCDFTTIHGEQKYPQDRCSYHKQCEVPKSKIQRYF